MTISLIAAIDKNNLIGSGNDLPAWEIKGDMQWFKTITMDKMVVMGRKTFESIGSRPLKDRINIVLTNSKDRLHPDIVQISDPEWVLNNSLYSEIMVIGGGQIYQQFINHAHRLYISQVDGEFEGDTYFPKIDPDKFKKLTSWKQVNYSIDMYRRV